MAEAGQIGWACTGHRPVRWHLGVVARGLIRHCVGSVERKADGSWRWWSEQPQACTGIVEGVAPSRVTAIAEVERNRSDGDG